MAANRFGIDVGGMYRDVEAIKGARTRNKMAGMELATAERLEEERPARELATKNRNIMVTDLKKKAVGGDKAARDRLLVLDSTTKDFISYIDKADAKQAKQSLENMNQMGRMIHVISKISDPTEREAKYKQAKSTLPKSVQDKWPETYNQKDVDLGLAKLNLMSDVAEHKVLTLGGEDILYQGEKEIERAEIPVKASSPLVSVNTGGDKKESEKLAELRVKRLDEIQQKAITAEDQIESINQIKAIDLDTGLGVETRGQIAKVWDSLGGDGKALTGVDPSDVQKFKAVATKQVLDIMASQKGPQTDQDAARIEKAVANLGNTKDANNFVMDSAIAIANRKIEQSTFMERYLENNGSLKGANAEWRDFKVKTPMVSDVIKDPETGAPVFFYQFRDKMTNRSYSDKDIVEAWRRMNAGGE